MVLCYVRFFGRLGLRAARNLALLRGDVDVVLRLIIPVLLCSRWLLGRRYVGFDG